MGGRLSVGIMKESSHEHEHALSTHLFVVNCIIILSEEVGDVKLR
jgi:hypothetical protein